MKISILIYSMASGGAERVVSLLLKHLNQKYEIELVLMNDTIFYEIPENVKITFLEKSNPTEPGLIKLLKLPFLAYKYSKIKSDISLSFMNRPNYINVLSKFFGKKSKIIISERAMPSKQHSLGLQGKINRFLIKTFYKKADLVIANSKGNSYDLQKNFCVKKIKTIYNPIEPKECQKTKNEKFMFVTIGRLDEGKNHALLIKALKESNLNANLLIIGDGPLRKELEDLSKSLNLKEKVKFLGIQKDVYRFLSKADCFVFSSNYEGFPNVLLEALNCSLPVISTDCKSGPREILAPETYFLKETESVELAKYGILVKPKSVENFAKAMKLMYQDKELRYNYAINSKKAIENFKIEKIIKEWERILDEFES
ncbi:glycosyltransferase [Caminibacter pacificus]|uniref:N-acetylgalactosamine-N, N'-diacetylbacillosaminyl-diphospho-undecaprenol 4-alpha-N-acetylgalactosaminyltransferase n=2 Tax=Caminibacter pacificus TaxID=1424653 RepID=A0AAJ4RC12_9BACT|nr:glycosyltransferase [Caminibacter pacificus]ROR39166.1 N-acetylgalactosamine-N,N'-diacetylbacillosaminyl-diphospho-undecaprenol 4-alpha-N-acetylgalactosaminyltransferase [Caminibacter pacificus]